MPFSSFFEVAVDFADVAFDAVDVGSFVDDFGTEFLNDFGDLGSVLEQFDQFEALSGFDYEQVGSFAGDADWFNLNSFGDIFGGPQPLDAVSGSLGGSGFFDGASDFFGELRDSVVGPELLAGPGSDSFSFGDGFFSGLLNNAPIPTETGVDFVSRTALGKLVDQAGSFVPSFDTLAAQAQKSITQQIVTTGIKAAAGAVSGQVAQIPVVGGVLAGAVNRTAGAVNTAVYQQVGGRTVTGPSLSSILGVPNIGIPNVPGIQLASLGNNIPLSLLKNPTGTVSVTGANGQPLNIQTPGFNPNAFSATAVNTAANPQVGGFFGEPPGTVQENPADIPLSDLVTEPPVDSAPSASSIDRSAGPVGYTVSADPEGGFAVVNLETGLPVATGLTEQQALLQAQEQTFIDAGEVPSTPTDTSIKLNAGPGVASGIAYDDEGNLLPGYSLDEDNNPVFVGGDFVEPATAAQAEADRTFALREQARQQQTIRAQRQNQAQSTDWRVRLRLAPTSDYLYNAPDCGPVLYPLRDSDGVIFPYTPTIDIGYKANYSHYDLIHSNYRGYFYQNSHIDQIQLKATFTAQDTTEANYLLAVIHFFRSVTKMFYGQDAERGSPPPLTYLSGLGDYQFNEHPCVVTQFNYNLPADVNYVRAQSVLSNGNNLLNARKRQTVLGNPLSYALQRLTTVGMTKGGLDQTFAPSGSLGADNSTYVPTKMEISLTLLPMQSRAQVSQQFSLRGFANGNLLKGGFW